MLSTTNHPAFQNPIDNQIDGITVNTDDVIADLMAADRPLIQIAMKHKLSFPQLIAWAAQPAVRAFLDAADELADRRAASTAAQSRHASIVVLTEQATTLCETPRGLELAGKAARTLFRSRRSPTPTPSAATPPMNTPSTSTDLPEREPIHRKQHPEKSRAASRRNQPKRQTSSNNPKPLPVPPTTTASNTS